MSFVKIYKCELTGDNNIISYTIKDNIATMEFIKIDYNNIKIFFQLLRSSIDELSENGIKEIYQHINCEEYEYFKNKKTSWEILSSYNDSNIDKYIIKCPIDDILENIGIGFGINKNLQI
jgi:hypothetical protein